MLTDLETLKIARRYQALCDQVRYASDAPVGEDWEVIGSDLNSSLGWRARAYRNKNDPKEIVVAFRGTKTFKEAYFMDSRIAIGIVPNIQHEINEWLKQNNLEPTAFTGHSLGGSLASIISVAQGQIPAWVFDTPGVPGYTTADLKNVTAFQSAQNPINNITAGYVKAGVVHEIPLPPDVVKQMALRQNSLEQLSKAYFVDNEATRAIKTAYKLVSTLQNLGDVHSIDNIGISINQQIALQDDKYNTETKQGPYSAQMLLRLEQANSFTQELIQKVKEGKISNSEFVAQRKAAEQALEDARTSLRIYNEKYKDSLSENDKDKLRRLDIQVEGLYTSVKDKNIESVRTDTTLERNQKNLQRNIDKEATPMVDQAFRALTSLNKDNINLAIEVLNSMGLKLTEPQEGLAKASLEAIGDLTRSYQRYRVYKREQQNNPKPPAGKPGKDDLPAPGEVFFSDILINVEQYFNAISLVGEKFGNPKIAKIGKIGACAANIVANTSALLGFGPLAVTPLGAVAAIGMSAITLFSAITGKSSQAQEQAEQLQQALQAISQQIANMEKLMVDLFEKSFENDQLILDAISQGFYEMQINFAKVDRMLNNIAAYLSTMSYENSQGFISLLIDRLHNTLFTTQKVMIGHYEKLRTLNRAGKVEVAKILLKNLEDLLYWMETGSKNPILIGTFHEFTSNKKQDLLKFHDLRKYPLEYTLGFLLKFIQNNYPQPGFTLSANDVFNISTWAMTANAYSNFTQTLDDESLAIFPPQEIQKLQGQGARLLSWISQLRSDERFADQLFVDYLGNLKKLTRMGQASYLQTNPLTTELDGSTVDYEHLMTPETQSNAEALVELTDAEQLPFQMLAELTGLDTHPDYVWDTEQLSFPNQPFSRFASKAVSNELILKNSRFIRSATVIREGVYEEMVVSQTPDLQTAISIYKFNNKTTELTSQNLHAELNGIMIYDILPHPESAAKK